MSIFFQRTAPLPKKILGVENFRQPTFETRLKFGEVGHDPTIYTFDSAAIKQVNNLIASLRLHPEYWDAHIATQKIALCVNGTLDQEYIPAQMVLRALGVLVTITAR